MKSELINKTLYRRFEGGAIYMAEEKGEFLVIVDESTMADLLPAEELADLALIKVINFKTELDRRDYLDERFGR
jgi:hypothetical protein